MGKKQNRKQHINKIQEAISNLTNEMLNNDDYEEDIESNANEFKFNTTSNSLTEANIMISKLVSDNEKDREVTAHILASTDISSLGEGKYYTYSNKAFLEAMISCFIKSNISTKANIVAGFINILVSSPLKLATVGAVHEPEKILLFSLNITDILNNFLKELISTLISVENSTKNQAKEQTLYDLIIDLFVYFSEIVILSKDEKNIFEPLVLTLCEIVVNSTSLKDKLSESSILNTIFVITELLGLRLLPSDNYNTLVLYKDYLQLKVDEITSSNQIEQHSEKLLLYLGSIFYVLFYSDSINVSPYIKQIVSFIVSNLNRFDSVFIENLKFINEKLLSVLEVHDDDEAAEDQMMIDMKKTHLSDEDQLKLVKDIRDKGLKSELIIKGIIQVTKIFNDIFHCYQVDEIQISESNTKDEDWEEVSEESIDEEESKVQDKIIKIFENKTNIIKCFSLDESNGLFNSLYSFVNATEKHTIVADSPHSIAIEELLHELEYSSLSLISNIIFNFSKEISLCNPNAVNSFTEITISKLNTLSTLDSSSANESNAVTLSLLLSTLRQIIDYQPNLKQNIKVTELLGLYNKYSNDQLIKMALIDLIGKICHGRTDISLEDNERICNYLLELLEYEKNDVEILAHVFNAFMDVFAVDEYNQILVKTNIINLMINGNVVKNLSTQVKSAAKVGNLDKEAKGYCKDTIVNLKAFLKYKSEKIPFK